MTFEDKIARKIERFQQTSYHILEKETTQKRLDWFHEHAQAYKQRPPSPRAAYELFFCDYLNLNPEEVPVLSETDDEIVWSSRNRCSTLEACQQAGLDTRKVCRAVFEKSTQVLISQLDPQLRFYRSYEEIRPHSQHCKEWIVRLDFEALMRLALEEAHQSKAEGNKGYGAVVVFGNRIVGKAHDTAITQNDPSLHAEMTAIRQAVRTLGDSNLCGAVLFSTCEPCPMCAALAIWANLTTLVYGISIEDTARLGRTRIQVGSRELVEKSPALLEIIGNVLPAECRALYE